MVSLRNLLRNLPSFCRVSDGKSDTLLQTAHGDSIDPSRRVVKEGGALAG